ncbi:MAG: Gldg family protein [Planctomycetes bacterium]|nr:Gldg family protein [Planctomycetota bacterium]
MMVNRKRNYTWHFLLMAIMTAIAIGVVNYLAMEHRLRLDLTADQRFSLSPGTKALFDKLPETVTVTYYVDEEPPAKRINLERDVRDKLGELATSSGGKLQFSVVRIANAEAAEKAKELEKDGITRTLDVMTTGDDEAAQTKGFQGFFSSIKVQYGTSPPEVINGIVNLYDRNDESAEHRVDTLEFDVAYALLRMKNKVVRPTLDRLLKARSERIEFRYIHSNDLPEQYKGMGQWVHNAMLEIAALAPQQVGYQQVMVGPDAPIKLDDAFGSGRKVEYPFVSAKKARLGRTETGELVQIPESAYYTTLMMRVSAAEKPYAIVNFLEDENQPAVKKRIEDWIWETLKPRSRLGFVLPPSLPKYQMHERPGSPPANGHTPLYNYISEFLGYDTMWVDIIGNKRIPGDLACLIVMEPNQLSERELYEIDRYLAEGGNVVMMVQGWRAELDFGQVPTKDDMSLQKLNMQPHFTDWATHIGVDFGQDLLLRKNARLSPFHVMSDGRGGQTSMPVPTKLKFAPAIAPQDLNAENVLTRGLAGLPMPLPIELKLNDARLTSRELQSTEIIRMKDGVYKFIPANPAFPTIPVNLDLDSQREVEQNASADPEKQVRAQLLDHDPLVAVHIKGRFPSLWADEQRKIPGWQGADPATETAPAVNGREGNLIIFTSADILNTEYFGGWTRQEIQPVVINRGISLYRNLSEAFIYGEDLVNLRARTGVSPRIAGPVSNNMKVFWFLVCIGGVPLLLVIVAGARSYVRLREREEYDAAFTGGAE